MYISRCLGCIDDVYLAGVVRLVVGDLHLLEGDHLLPQLLGREGGVRVGVETVGRGGVRLARHQPRGAVVGVPAQCGPCDDLVTSRPPDLVASPVALVVARHDVEQHEVAAALGHVPEAHPHRWEHSPDSFVCLNIF